MPYAQTPANVGYHGHRLNLSVFIAGSSMLGITMYLAAALSPVPVVGLAACAITGL